VTLFFLSFLTFFLPKSGRNQHQITVIEPAGGINKVYLNLNIPGLHLLCLEAAGGGCSTAGLLAELHQRLVVLLLLLLLLLVA